MKEKTLVLRILIPVCILIVIVVIWFVKTGKSVDEAEDTNTEAATVEEVSNELALDVTSELDVEQLKSYGLPIIIDFGADSCIPCKEMAPVLKELNRELSGKAIILFVDVWKYPDLAQGFPISLIPTQVLINSDGTPYTPSDELSKNVQMYSSKEGGEHVFTTHEGGLTKETMLAFLKEMGLQDD